MEFKLKETSPWKLGWIVVVGLTTVGLLVISKEKRDQVRRWFLLDGDRWEVVSLLILLVFILSFVLGLTPLVAIAEQRFSTTIFGSITSGLLSLIPIVIAVNQLTMSQLFSTPDELRKNMQNIQNFRKNIGSRFPEEPTAPTNPDDFLSKINSHLAEVTTELQDSAKNIENEHLSERIEEYCEDILEDAEEIDNKLQKDNPPLIQILSPIMDDHYSQNINISRTIVAEHSEILTPRTTELLKELRDLFVAMDVLRQYLKSLYIQEELARLSKLIAYTGSGAFVLSSFAVMVFAGRVPLPIPPYDIQLAVSATLALTFTPVAVLVAFVARIATIVRHTVAPGTFTPQSETEDII